MSLESAPAVGRSGPDKARRRGLAHRHIGMDRNAGSFVAPSLDEPMHAVVGAVISAPTQLLKQPLGRWQGGRGMRIMTVALGTALVLCNLGTFSAAAHAQAQVVREPRERPMIKVPVFRTTPYWDYNIVPRYRYRPQDDRVD